MIEFPYALLCYSIINISHLIVDPQSFIISQANHMLLQVPAGSLAAKAGLLPTARGFAGNIVLGDIIVAVDNNSVSFLSLKLFSFLFMHSTLLLLLRCKINSLHIIDVKLSFKNVLYIQKSLDHNQFIACLKFVGFFLVLCTKIFFVFFTFLDRWNLITLSLIKPSFKSCGFASLKS